MSRPAASLPAARRPHARPKLSAGGCGSLAAKGGRPLRNGRPPLCADIAAAHSKILESTVVPTVGTDKPGLRLFGL